MNEIFKLIAESGRTDLMEEWFEIEKKLEVLEILKEKINFKDNEKWIEYYLSTNTVDEYITLQLNENGNYDKFYKIKEWLEDEKQ